MKGRKYMQRISICAVVISWLSLLLLPGCISFPVGSGVVVSQSDSQPRTISEKRTPLSGQSTEFVSSTADLKNVYVSAVTVTNKIERETVVDRTVKKVDKIFLIGLFPALSTNWAVGKTAKGYEDIGLCIATPIATGLYAGIPMIVGWIQEGFVEWEPVDFGKTEYRQNSKGETVRDTGVWVFDRGIRQSIIGWARTGRTYSTTYPLAQPSLKLEKTEPFSSTTALITIPGTAIQCKAMTDGEGRLVIDPSILPVRTQKPLALRAEFISASPAIKPQEILIPAESFGTCLFDDNTLKTISSSKFLDFGEELDFSYIESQTGAKLTVLIEDKGPETGDSRMIQITVANQGSGACSRLLGRTQSSFAALNEQLLIFGTVRPGQSVTRTINVRVPAPAFEDTFLPFSIQFKDAGGVAPQQNSGNVLVKSIPRPKFFVAVHLEKEDGVVCEKINRGDVFTLVVDVSNTGAVAARSSNFTLTLPDDKSLKTFEERTRELPAELAPGAKTTLKFNLVMSASGGAPICKMEAREADSRFNESKDYTVPVASP